MKRTFPVGEVTDLRAGEFLDYVCHCGSEGRTFIVQSVTAKMALVMPRGRAHAAERPWRIKRRDIIYRDGRTFGDRYRLRRFNPAPEKTDAE